jgi:hypothetical protein
MWNPLVPTLHPLMGRPINTRHWAATEPGLIPDARVMAATVAC